MMNLHPYRHAQRSASQLLFEGHERGYWVLDESMLGLRTAVQTLGAEWYAASQVPTDRELDDAARVEAQEAARSGHYDGVAAMDRLRAAKAHAAEQRAGAAILREELTKAQQRVDRLGGTQGTIPMLRPVFDEVLDAVAPLAKVLEGQDLSEAGIAAAPAKVRGAYLEVLPQLARHEALRAVQLAVESPFLDPRCEWFLDTRLWPTLNGPGVYTLTRQTARLPGPAESLPRLLWLSRPEAEAWYPTDDERVAELERVFAVFADPDHGTRWARYLARGAEVRGGRPGTAERPPSPTAAGS